MKTGMMRPVDKMGRVVIPKEIRAKLDVESNRDYFEIFVEDDRIILKKYHPTCIFCDANDDIIEYNGHNVCKACIEKIKNL